MKILTYLNVSCINWTKLSTNVMGYDGMQKKIYPKNNYTYNGIGTQNLQE